MDRIRINSFSRQLVLLLVVTVIIGSVGDDASAQRSQRSGSKQAAAWSKKKTVNRVAMQEPTPAEEETPIPANDIVDPTDDDAYAWDDYSGDLNCASSCDVSCGNSISCSTRCAKPSIYGGFEAVLIKPRFENNIAYTVRDGDSTFQNFTDVEFDYNMEFTPRAFVGWRHQDGVGLRATWWLFDHSAADASASPPSSTNGLISHPPFGNVDISTVDPTDVFSATTALNAYAIDLEATKMATFCSWDLGIGCGVRYAYTSQSYQAQLRDDDNQLRGSIDYTHSLEGIGPTISLEAFRPVVGQVSIFGKARGSVLFGDGDSSLSAIEDADLSNSLTTTRQTHRDDLLSIAEVQLGFLWKASQKCGRTCRPFLSMSMEGQVWNGAGNATSEDGTLGFFGLNSGVGVEW